MYIGFKEFKVLSYNVYVTSVPGGFLKYSVGIGKRERHKNFICAKVTIPGLAFLPLDWKCSFEQHFREIFPKIKELQLSCSLMLNSFRSGDLKS